MNSGKTAGNQPEPGYVGQFKDYLEDSVEELKKVSTPTRAETMQATTVAIILVSVMAVCLFLLDLVYIQLRQALFTIN